MVCLRLSCVSGGGGFEEWWDVCFSTGIAATKWSWVWCDLGKVRCDVARLQNEFEPMTEAGPFACDKPYKYRVGRTSDRDPARDLVAAQIN